MDKQSGEPKQWWQPAVNLFGQVTGLIVIPIVAALYGGRALDRKFQSEPVFFLGLTVLAILISTVAIVRISSRYMRDIEREARKKNQPYGSTGRDNPKHEQ